MGNIDLETLGVVDRGETLADQVYERVRHALIAGAFEPGETITIRTIARSMHVSLTPVRDVLARMVAEGVLELGTNRKAQVPLLAEPRIAEIYRLRLAIEPQAAESACLNLGPRDVAALTRLLAGHDAAFDRKDYRAALDCNSRFHFTIYRAADVPITLRLIENLWLLIGPTMHRVCPEFEMTREGVEAHRGMIKAIKARDPQALADAVRIDLLTGKTSLLNSMVEYVPVPHAARLRRVPVAAD